MEHVQKYLDRIDFLNPQINAVVSRYSVDEIKAQTPTKDSLVFLIKDNMCTTDLPTTCSSKVLEGYISPLNATVVEQIRSEGGVILGKCNMDEFAMGTNTSHTCYGQTFNPIFPNEERSPGGSSGGSAAAVAAGFCDVALGTDTGGSTRLPGAFCSVFGFKPSYGRLSRNGVVAYSKTLDTIGILSGTIAHMQKAFSYLDKYDPQDSRSCRPELRARFPKEIPNRPLKIGVMKEATIDMTEPVREAWIKCLETLSDMGHTIVQVSVPNLKYALPTYMTLSSSEGCSNFSKYAGTRETGVDSLNEFGPVYRSKVFDHGRAERMGGEVRRRMLLGTYNLTDEAYEEHFLKAEKVRAMIIKEINSVFSAENLLFPDQKCELNDLGVDVIVNPTSPRPSHKLGEYNSEMSVLDILGDALTIPFNLGGYPSLSVPAGKSIGMHIAGQYGNDSLVLHVGELIDNIFQYKNSI